MRLVPALEEFLQSPLFLKSQRFIELNRLGIVASDDQFDAINAFFLKFLDYFFHDLPAKTLSLMRRLNAKSSNISRMTPSILSSIDLNHGNDKALEFVDVKSPSRKEFIKSGAKLFQTHDFPDHIGIDGGIHIDGMDRFEIRAFCGAQYINLSYWRFCSMRAKINAIENDKAGKRARPADQRAERAQAGLAEPDPAPLGTHGDSPAQ